MVSYVSIMFGYMLQKQINCQIFRNTATSPACTPVTADRPNGETRRRSPLKGRKERDGRAAAVKGNFLELGGRTDLQTGVRLPWMGDGGKEKEKEEEEEEECVFQSQARVGRDKSGGGVSGTDKFSRKKKTNW